MTFSRLMYLNDLAHLVSLQELYMRNNLVSELKDLQFIPPKLIILDLSGNQVSLDPSYRQFIIKKCPDLKWLDNEFLHSNEQNKSSIWDSNPHKVNECIRRAQQPDEEVTMTFEEDSNEQKVIINP